MSDAVMAAAPPTPWHEFRLAFARNRGALAAFAVFALIATGALLAPLLAPHDPVQQFRDHLLTPPMWQPGGLATYPLGTDELGRCLLSRLLFGARVSLGIGLLAVLLALLPGVVLGLVAAMIGSIKKGRAEPSCPVCGYDFAGLPRGSLCPECGPVPKAI